MRCTGNSAAARSAQSPGCRRRVRRSGNFDLVAAARDSHAHRFTLARESAPARARARSAKASSSWDMVATVSRSTRATPASSDSLNVSRSGANRSSISLKRNENEGALAQARMRKRQAAVIRGSADRRKARKSRSMTRGPQRSFRLRPNSSSIACSRASSSPASTPFRHHDRVKKPRLIEHSPRLRCDNTRIAARSCQAARAARPPARCWQ